jgi:hypothetical protein
MAYEAGPLIPSRDDVRTAMKHLDKVKKKDLKKYLKRQKFRAELSSLPDQTLWFLAKSKLPPTVPTPGGAERPILSDEEAFHLAEARKHLKKAQKLEKGKGCYSLAQGRYLAKLHESVAAWHESQAAEIAKAILSHKKDRPA